MLESIQERGLRMMGRMALFGLICLVSYGQVFPDAAADDGDLLVQGFRAQSTLAQTIDANDTSLIVSSLSNFTDNMGLVIDDEALICTTFSGGTFSGCTRGVDGTTAAAHTIGAIVGARNIPCYHNCLKDEVKAVGDYLGNTSQASLPDDALAYCTDCTEEPTCGSGGSGAYARCRSGTCECFWGGTAIGRGWVPIEIGRAANATTEDFTVPSGSCSELMLVLRTITVTTDGTEVDLRVATGGAVHTTQSYEHNSRIIQIGSNTVGASGSSRDTALRIYSLSNGVDNGADSSYSAIVWVRDPNQTGEYKQFSWEASYKQFTTLSLHYVWGGGAWVGSTTPLTTIQVLFSSAATGGEIDFFGLDCD